MSPLPPPAWIGVGLELPGKFLNHVEAKPPLGTQLNAFLCHASNRLAATIIRKCGNRRDQACRLPDHRHNSQQPAPQAKPRLPTTEAEGLQPALAKKVQAGSEVPTSTAEAPPPRGAAWSGSRPSLCWYLHHLAAGDCKKNAPPPPAKKLHPSHGEILAAAVTAWLCLAGQEVQSKQVVI
jgi:hypothetical protein